MSGSTGDGRIPPKPAGKKTTTKAVNAVKRPKSSEVPSVEESVTISKSSTPSSTDDLRHPFGVRRLDDLLGGGLKSTTFTLLYGPAFLGKEQLSYLMIASALEHGVPAIIIHTDATHQDVQEKLGVLAPNIADHAKAGLLQYVDCYSRSIDVDDSTLPNVHYVDGPMDLNGISLAVNEAQRRLQADHDHHVLAINSLSTVIAYSDARTAFRFLQVLLGKDRRVGGTSLILMDQGMHADDEVQMIRHLMNGSIDVRDHNGKFQLKVQGITTQESLNWIDYRYQQGRFEVTGSFAPGRIR